VVSADLSLTYHGEAIALSHDGNGPIDAAKKALEKHLSAITIHHYSEHSLSQGSDSNAICYLSITYNNKSCYGVGVDSNITIASVKALISAINRIIFMTEVDT